jgi:hypothetical protein
MSTQKRYIFQGHAVAVETRRGKGNGWIKGAMALPVTGGYGQIEVDGSTFPIPDGQRYPPFTSASAFVSGDFDDPDDKDSTTRTVTAAYVTDLNWRDRIRAKSLSAHLVLEDRRDGQQPRISFGEKNPFTKATETDPIVGLTIDGFPVNLEFDPIVRQFHTLEELQEQYLRQCDIELYGGTIATSIVKSISWAGGENKKATIVDNTITVEDFGTIFVGEILIDARSRHLTLLRVRMGEDAQDNDSGGDVRPGSEGYP